MKEERGKKKVESRKWGLSRLLFLVVLLSACVKSETVEVHSAWVRSALAGENSAVYLILHNHTSQADSLINISADVANAVELHSTEVSNDVMQMRKVESIEMLVDSEIVFESGGYHIMLIGLKQDLNVGDEITITLHFENAPDLVIPVPVQDSAGEEHHHP